MLHPTLASRASRKFRDQRSGGVGLYPVLKFRDRDEQPSPQSHQPELGHYVALETVAGYREGVGGFLDRQDESHSRYAAAGFPCCCCRVHRLLRRLSAFRVQETQVLETLSLSQVV